MRKLNIKWLHPTCLMYKKKHRGPFSQNIQTMNCPIGKFMKQARNNSSNSVFASHVSVSLENSTIYDACTTYAY